MQIIITASELIDRGLWLKYCEITGINEWAVNEGLMDSDEQLSLTQEQAIKLHIIEKGEEVK